MISRDRLRRFASVVDVPDADIELDTGALLVGDWEYDPADAEGVLVACRRQLDDIAGLARLLAPTDGKPWAGARGVSRALFTELGYAGNQDDYYDPKNSFLSEVVLRKTGIPITLSVLYLEIARRLGVRAIGISFPGHFLVRVENDDGDSIVIDPFHAGMVLSRRELESLLHKVVGPEAQLDGATLAPASNRQILTRTLLNLAGIYGRSGDLFRSIEVLERLAILDKGNPKLASQLDALRARVEQLN